MGKKRCLSLASHLKTCQLGPGRNLKHSTKPNWAESILLCQASTLTAYSPNSFFVTTLCTLIFFSLDFTHDGLANNNAIIVFISACAVKYGQFSTCEMHLSKTEFLKVALNINFQIFIRNLLLFRV